ncbi:unnamed protein product [Paramecium sonneborni]|uniref:Uncharacterized protein n=1 Tax=Paramecium sonneborni TaxID=65129 RepID=A0A8S1MJ30_9CILI|nr:unnamed protein product [Paramecium sonneborni]
MKIKIQDYQRVLENFVQNIILVSKDQFIQKSREILVKIQNDFKTYSYEIIEKNSSHLQQIVLPLREKQLQYCLEHPNQQIMLLDLQEQPDKMDRVACLNCLIDHPAKYETLQDAEKKWNQWVTLKKNNLNNYVRKTQDKALELTNFLEECKQKMFLLAQSISMKINQKTKNQIQQIKDTFQIPKNVRIDEVSVQDLIKIAKDISSPQNQEQFLELLQTGFNKWNEENDQILKEFELKLFCLINELQSKKDKKNNSLEDYMQTTHPIIKTEILSLRHQIEEQEKQIIKIPMKENQLKAKDNQQQQLENQLKSKENQIKQLEGLLKQKDEQLKQLESQLQTKDNQLKQSENLLKSKNNQIKQLEEQFKQQDSQLKQLEGQLKQKDNQLKQLESQLYSKDSQLKKLENSIKSNKQFKPFQEQLEQKDDCLRQLNNQLNQKDQQIKQLEEQSKSYIKSISQLEGQLFLKDQQLQQEKKKSDNSQQFLGNNIGFQRPFKIQLKRY